VTPSEYQKAHSILSQINTQERNGKERYLAIIVNPISGQRKSVEYYQNVLKPMLNYSGIKHDMYQTNSPTYVDELISSLDIDETPYTDLILIGGDGTFAQIINAYDKHPQREKFMKIPVGFVPGGSAN